MSSLFDVVREKYSISLDPLIKGKVNESAVRFIDGQFPGLLHPGEKRRRHKPYHVAWYRHQGTRGSLRTTYDDPTVWALSGNFFLNTVAPIVMEIYCRLSPGQLRAAIKRREKKDGSMIILQIMM
ncbi:hypothetical protein BT69DRAFT_1296740 [Atractiella rhizophila]|nr:hypothetical protein BT69DRAFT_1296740 [Atractiella rhizophila]